MLAINKDKLTSRVLKDSGAKSAAVLIVDDEPNNLKVLEGALGRDFELLKADSGKTALEVINSYPDKNRIKVIVTDQRMPEMTGVEMLAESLKIIPNAMRIIVTGYADMDVVMEGVNQCGLYQFMLKPFDREALLLTVKRAVETFDLEETINFQAFNDMLTGLPNRNAFTSFLKERIHEYYAQGRRFSVLLLDMDNFKVINDTMGHPFGDLVLRMFADRLTQKAGEDVFVARVSGDEFGIFLPSMAGTDAANYAECLVSALDSPLDVKGTQVDLISKIGVACFPEHADDATALIQHSDMAMYSAKRSQRSVALYDSSLNRFTPDRLSLMSELKTALERNEIQLFYQPLLDVETGLVKQMESLVRWRHPTKGYRAPDEFIPLAEQTKYIARLTPWVLRTAIEQCADWHRNGVKLNVTVNISGVDLDGDRFPVYVQDLLTAYNLEPSTLMLELSESAIVRDPVETMPTLNRLHEMGVRLSITDFGTGYSSMKDLIRLPVDELKIGRDFIIDMDKHPGYMRLVRAIIDLGHRLGMTVAAVGAENVQVLTALREYGCDRVQGNFISRAIPPDQVIDWFENSPYRWIPELAEQEKYV